MTPGNLTDHQNSSLIKNRFNTLSKYDYTPAPLQKYFKVVEHSYRLIMAELKTKATKESVKDFLSKVEPVGKREDSFALLEMFTDVTGEKAVMWGDSIVGFGMYHYKSE